jgi:hypothetical protein
MRRKICSAQMREVVICATPAHTEPFDQLPSNYTLSLFIPAPKQTTMSGRCEGHTTTVFSLSTTSVAVALRHFSSSTTTIQQVT